MRIVDAVWEKRNLDKVTVEITVDRADTAQELGRVLASKNAEYQVVKIPTERVDLSETLKNNGFTFVETICGLKNDLRNTTLDMINERMKSQMQCKVMSESDLELMYADFMNGTFSTDRVALDPEFSIELANKRYIGWIHDALDRGAVALTILYRDEPAGFVIYKQDGSEADVMLGGMFSKFLTKGIGVAVYSKAYEYMKEQGVKKAFTAVSTNNYSSYRANAAIGYDVTRFDYVFVKHVSR